MLGVFFSHLLFHLLANTTFFFKKKQSWRVCSFMIPTFLHILECCTFLTPAHDNECNYLDMLYILCAKEKKKNTRSLLFKQ
ncbi:hypothetical protein GGR50DRAFT_673007 [Xylaria sp. CBS 124048]|nr:hypothetical protein GGR50DRAFT_673007 [Xylaria sp. CBS 124048]